jgi:hypothetical protein
MSMPAAPTDCSTLLTLIGSRACSTTDSTSTTSRTVSGEGVAQRLARLLGLGSGGDKRPENQTPKEFDIFDPRAKYQAS